MSPDSFQKTKEKGKKEKEIIKAPNTIPPFNSQAQRNMGCPFPEKSFLRKANWVLRGDADRDLTQKQLWMGQGQLATIAMH